MNKNVIVVFKNLALTMFFTSCFIILSSALMTYYKIGFEAAIYLIQLSVIIPVFVVALLEKNKRNTYINSFLYIIILNLVIFFSISEFVFNINMIFFIFLIILSTYLGNIINPKSIDK